jgi:hypothetical protein
MTDPAAILDAIDGEPVTVLAASHHIVVGAGPAHRQANTYLTVSAALRLAAELATAAEQVARTAE